MTVSASRNNVVSVNEDELIYTLIMSRCNPIAKVKLDAAFNVIKEALNNINVTFPSLGEENASVNDELNKRIAVVEATMQTRESAVRVNENVAQRFDEISKHLERIESQIALNMHNNNMLQVSMHKMAERMEALEKHNRTAEGDKMTLNDLYARVGVLDVRAKGQDEITYGLCSSARKQQTTIDNLCGRLEALERKVDANTDIAREWRKASRCNQEDRDKTLACAYNDLHSRLADIEGRAAKIYNGVIFPLGKVT